LGLTTGILVGLYEVRENCFIPSEVNCMATKLISEATTKSSLASTDMIPIAAAGEATAYHVTGEGLFDSLPAATTEISGVVELATYGEVAAGTADKIPDASQLALFEQSNDARQADTGGDTRGAASVDLQVTRSNADEIAEGDYGFIGGGADNKIEPESDYGAIVGGYQNVINGDSTPVPVPSDYSFIGGGRENVVSGLSDYCAVVGGRENVCGNAFANIVGGYGAATRNYGEHAQASGYFAAVGDGQYSRFVARRSVAFSDTNWKTLYLDGASELMGIDVDTVWMFDVLLVGTTSGCSKSFGFRIVGVIENDGGTTTILNSSTTTYYDADDSSFDAQAAADDTNDALLIQVKDTDGGGDTVRFVAVVQVAAVSF
jgi:hypothetical protein